MVPWQTLQVVFPLSARGAIRPIAAIVGEPMRSRLTDTYQLDGRNYPALKIKLDSARPVDTVLGMVLHDQMLEAVRSKHADNRNEIQGTAASWPWKRDAYGVYYLSRKEVLPVTDSFSVLAGRKKGEFPPACMAELLGLLRSSWFSPVELDATAGIQRYFVTHPAISPQLVARLQQKT